MHRHACRDAHRHGHRHVHGRVRWHVHRHVHRHVCRHACRDMCIGVRLDMCVTGRTRHRHFRPAVVCYTRRGIYPNADRHVSYRGTSAVILGCVTTVAATVNTTIVVAMAAVTIVVWMVWMVVVCGGRCQYVFCKRQSAPILITNQSLGQSSLLYAIIKDGRYSNRCDVRHQ